MLGRLIELSGGGVSVFVVSPNGISQGPGAELVGHSRGVMVAGGLGIAADAMLPGANTVDFAPTILARYGLAWGADGRVMRELVPAGEVSRAAVWPRVGVLAVGEPVEDPADALLLDGYGDAITPEMASGMEQVACGRCCIPASRPCRAATMRGPRPCCARCW